MKNLLILCFLVLSFTAYADVCNEGRSTSWDATGTVRADSLDQCYVKVSNVDQGTLAKGSIVILDPTVENGYEIATSSTAGAVPHCMIMEACAEGAKCKCQTYGYTDILLFDVTNEAATKGEPIFISEGSKGYVQSELLAGRAASDIVIGEFKEAETTASGAIKAFLRLK